VRDPRSSVDANWGADGRLSPQPQGVAASSSIGPDRDARYRVENNDPLVVTPGTKWRCAQLRSA